MLCVCVCLCVSVGLISEQKNFLFRFTFLLKVWSSETASLTVLEADDEGQAKPGQTRPDQVMSDQTRSYQARHGHTKPD